MAGVDRDKWRDRAIALRPGVPDPRAPMPLARAAGRTQRRTLNQQRNRSLILSSTRQLVVEQGLDNVHMQDVAARSSMSVQTLYNTVGNRQQMLASAATEWVVSMSHVAREMCQDAEVSACFTMLELFWAASISEPIYGAQLVLSSAHRGFLERPFLETTKLVIREQLAIVRAEGDLVPWVEEALLAESIAVAAHACISGWLAKPYDEGRFYHAIASGCGMMLRGACRGREATRLERSFDLGLATPGLSS